MVWWSYGVKWEVHLSASSSADETVGKTGCVDSCGFSSCFGLTLNNIIHPKSVGLTFFSSADRVFVTVDSISHQPSNLGTVVSPRLILAENGHCFFDKLKILCH